MIPKFCRRFVMRHAFAGKQHTRSILIELHNLRNRPRISVEWFIAEQWNVGTLYPVTNFDHDIILSSVVFY